MRINKFVAQATGMSRRAADQAIAEGRVTINGQPASPGADTSNRDAVVLDNMPITPPVKTLTIALNKPVGYVCSRNGQGSKTIYDLLPTDYQPLKPVGRLDKDSSGLLLLTNDGDLANQLTHPRYQKEKVYEVALDKPLSDTDQSKLTQGVRVDNYMSNLHLSHLKMSTDKQRWQVTMTEGRNRQIRRTFQALGYSVTRLHRIRFGRYTLQGLVTGKSSRLD